MLWDCRREAISRLQPLEEWGASVVRPRSSKHPAGLPYYRVSRRTAWDQRGDLSLFGGTEDVALSGPSRLPSLREDPCDRRQSNGN